MRPFPHRNSLVLSLALTGLSLAGCQPPDTSTETPSSAASLGQALLENGGTTVRLTIQSNYQFDPVMSGSRVVYVDNRHGNYELYAMDLVTGLETRVTTDPGNQLHHDLSGDYLVYEDWQPNASVELRAYDFRTGAGFPITNDVITGSETAPAISGHRVVYGSNRETGGGVFLYDLISGVEMPLEQQDPPWITARRDSNHPDISGSRVVWQERWSGLPTADDTDIMLYDLSTGERRQLTTDTKEQTNPAIDGNYVVYEDMRHGNREIYLYDLSTNQETRITNDPNEQRRPRIADGVIVWVDDRHQPYGTEIYAHEIATGKQYRITEDSFIQGSPTTSGGRIIWQDSRYDQTELYMFSPRQ
jgi:beta propeller repeat protein